VTVPFAVSARVNFTMPPLCTTRPTLVDADGDSLMTRTFTFDPRANGVLTVADITPVAETFELTTFVPFATVTRTIPVAGAAAALPDVGVEITGAVADPHGRFRYMVFRPARSPGLNCPRLLGSPPCGYMMDVKSVT
jgi:hypothetical protein